MDTYGNSSRKIKVLVTVTTSPANPYIHKSVCFATDKILLDKRYEKTIMRPSYNPFENNLHHIVKTFIEGGDWDFWLNIDSDNPPMNNPLDLVEYDRDIIGLPTPVWHFDEKNKKPGESPIYFNGYISKPGTNGYTEFPEKNGLQEVDAIGTGCLLIARRVFLNKEMRKAPFQRTYLEDGRVEKGNDIAFSEKAKKNGFRLFVHYDYICEHFNELPLTEVMKAFFNQYRGL